MLAIGLLVALGTQATPVPQGPPAAPDESAFRVSLDGMITGGSVRRLLVVARTSVSVTGERVGIYLEPGFVYGRQGARLSEREPAGRLFVYLRPRARTFGFALGTMDASLLRQIDLRWQAGVGAGFWLSRGPAHSAKLTMAVLREHVDFSSRSDRGSWRITLRAKSSHRWSRLRVAEEAWWQPSLSDKGDHRASARVWLELPLDERSALRVSFEDDYDAVVAPGRSNHNYRATLGVAFGKGTPP